MVLENTIEKLNYEIIDDKIKIKRGCYHNHIIRTENVKEDMPYMKAFILLS